MVRRQKPGGALHDGGLPAKIGGEKFLCRKVGVDNQRAVERTAGGDVGVQVKISSFQTNAIGQNHAFGALKLILESADGKALERKPFLHPVIAFDAGKSLHLLALNHLPFEVEYSAVKERLAISSLAVKAVQVRGQENAENEMNSSENLHILNNRYFG